MYFILVFLENFRSIDTAFDTNPSSNSQSQGSNHRANNAICTHDRWLKKFRNEININEPKLGISARAEVWRQSTLPPFWEQQESANLLTWQALHTHPRLLKAVSASPVLHVLVLLCLLELLPQALYPVVVVGRGSVAKRGRMEMINLLGTCHLRLGLGLLLQWDL